MSGRSVMAPDPMIELNEIGIPESIAKTITPEKVTNENRGFLEKCLENGPNIFPGSVGLIRKNSKSYKTPKGPYHSIW